MTPKYDVQYWERKIEEILNRFDFTRVYRTMEALDWRWGLDRIPDVEEMRKTSRRLLEECTKASYLDGKDHQVSTGGFETETIVEDGYVSLKFVAEGEDTWDEN